MWNLRIIKINFQTQIKGNMFTGAEIIEASLINIYPSTITICYFWRRKLNEC
jgi:hypothetical protein